MCQVPVVVATEFTTRALVLLELEAVRDGEWVASEQDGLWRAVRGVPVSLAPRYRPHTCEGGTPAPVNPVYARRRPSQG